MARVSVIDAAGELVQTIDVPDDDVQHCILPGQTAVEPCPAGVVARWDGSAWVPKPVALPAGAEFAINWPTG